jgi:membrane protease YdiL (CAAX protease family)
MAYVGVGQISAVQKAIPSLLLFFLLALLILFPIEISIVCFASKKAFGRFSLKSAFTNHQKRSWWQIALFGSLAWLFAGLMTFTIAPIENTLFAPISERLSGLLPAYFDWTNFEYLKNYTRSTLLLTAVVLLIFNGFVGPIIEELFFRGYLTARISRFGKYAPLIITVLFSLYHFWLPFNNFFRIIAFFPAFYITWKKRNIFISILTHCLSNLFSTISIILMISTFL